MKLTQSGGARLLGSLSARNTERHIKRLRYLKGVHLPLKDAEDGRCKMQGRLFWKFVKEDQGMMVAAEALWCTRFTMLPSLLGAKCQLIRDSAFIPSSSDASFFLSANIS